PLLRDLFDRGLYLPPPHRRAVHGVAGAGAAYAAQPVARLTDAPTPGACAAIAVAAKDWYLGVMEELFGDPCYKGFVLQAEKGLPARSYAWVSGSASSRLR